MSFQLVRASDTDIAVWQTEHGHIYVFHPAPRRDILLPLVVRGAPDAAEPAERFADEALRYATREAEVRGMLATVPGGARGAGHAAAR